MTKRRLDDIKPAAVGDGAPSCCTYPQTPGLDLVCRWLHALVRHYDSLEWTIGSNGLQRTSNFPVTAFHGRPLPMSVEQFLIRFRTHAKFDDGVFLVAAVYLSRIIEGMAGLPVSSCTVHRLLLAALTIGAKFVHDSPLPNKAMAMIAGIPLSQLNKLEIKFLCGIQYNLAVSPADISTATDALHAMEADKSFSMAECTSVDNMVVKREEEVAMVGRSEEEVAMVGCSEEEVAMVGRSEEEVASNNYDDVDIKPLKRQRLAGESASTALCPAKLSTPERRGEYALVATAAE